MKYMEGFMPVVEAAEAIWLAVVWCEMGLSSKDSLTLCT